MAELLVADVAGLAAVVREGGILLRDAGSLLRDLLKCVLKAIHNPELNLLLQEALNEYETALAMFGDVEEAYNQLQQPPLTLKMEFTECKKILDGIINFMKRYTSGPKVAGSSEDAKVKVVAKVFEKIAKTAMGKIKDESTRLIKALKELAPRIEAAQASGASTGGPSGGSSGGSGPSSGASGGGSSGSGGGASGGGGGGAAPGSGGGAGSSGSGGGTTVTASSASSGGPMVSQVATGPLGNSPKPADPQKLQLLHRIFDGKEPVKFKLLKATRSPSGLMLPHTSVHVEEPRKGEPEPEVFLCPGEELSWDVIGEVLGQVLGPDDNLRDYIDVQLIEGEEEKVDPPSGVVQLTSSDGVLQVEGDILGPPETCPSCLRPIARGASYNHRVGMCTDCVHRLQLMRQSASSLRLHMREGLKLPPRMVSGIGVGHEMHKFVMSGFVSAAVRASRGGTTRADELLAEVFPEVARAEHGPAAELSARLAEQIATNVGKALVPTSTPEDIDRAFSANFAVQGLPENIVECTLKPCKPEEAAPCWDSVVAIPVEGTITFADAAVTEVKGVLVACYLPEPARIRVCDAKFWLGDERFDFDPFWRLREDDFPIDYLGESLADGSTVKSGTCVKQTWRIRNAGKRVWDHRIWLVEEDPEDEDFPEQYQVPAGVKPGEEAEVTVLVDVPTEPGPFEKEFRVWLFTEHTDNIFTVELVSDPNAEPLPDADPDQGEE